MTQPSRSEPDTDRFLTWLSRTAIDVREASGAKQEDIASRSRVGIDAIRRFERAETMPRNHETVIATYAYYAGITDPIDLYQTAIDQWRSEGQSPTLAPKFSAPAASPKLPPGPNLPRATTRRAPRAG